MTLTDPMPSGAPWREPAAARYVGMSAGHLANLRCAGKGPAYLKIPGGGIRYYQADLDAWLNSGTRVEAAA